MYTAGVALLDALHEAGIDFIFANFGSDHPAIVEALAEAEANGRGVPRVITCPNEMVALSAAQGYAQASGRAQAVLVHVDCGTQALAGAVHNAARGRAPVLIFAGLSPSTQQGELPGSRNEFIQWIQDVPDQAGIVRGYVKYSNELRTGRNIKQVVYRALQIAHSTPAGPVYLTAAREVLEEAVPDIEVNAAAWQPTEPAALSESGVKELVSALCAAKRPLVITSYLGRDPDAVGELLRLVRRLGIGVLESVPSHLNFPTDDQLYLGNYWNHPVQQPALAEADFILVIDSDVPWIEQVNRPSERAQIYHIDLDPLKPSMPLWQIAAHKVFGASSRVALAQINSQLDDQELDEAGITERRAHYSRLHTERAASLRKLERLPDSGITCEYALGRLRAFLDEQAIVVNEGISHYHTVINHLARTEPGTLLASGGGSLGWSGGAAIGIKLAKPKREVVVLTGDGSYLFSIPSTVHWMARHYDTPFITLVFNNRGWKSPKLSALAVHPDGHASRAHSLPVEFDPPPDYAGIAAAAGGAFAAQVHSVDELESALAEGFRIVREERRCAVIDLWLDKL